MFGAEPFGTETLGGVDRADQVVANPEPLGDRPHRKIRRAEQLDDTFADLVSNVGFAAPESTVAENFHALPPSINSSGYRLSCRPPCRPRAWLS